jgi:hypothetical protein
VRANHEEDPFCRPSTVCGLRRDTAVAKPSRALTIRALPRQPRARVGQRPDGSTTYQNKTDGAKPPERAVTRISEFHFGVTTSPQDQFANISGRSRGMLATHMVHRGASAADGSPLRTAPLLLIAAVALQCQSPARDGLFQSPPLGSAGAPSVNPGAMAAPPGSDAEFVPGGGASASSAGSAEGSPPLMGVGGATEQDLPSTGGVMDSPDAGVAGATSDAGGAPIDNCVLGEFRSPEPLTGLEQGLNPELTLGLWSPSLSADGLSLFFGVSSDGGDEQIATATRADRGTVFGPAVEVPEINSAGQDGTPMLSADGLSLYFYSTRAGGLGSRDLWLSTRSDTAAEFTNPTLIAGVNTPAFDHVPWISPDELTLIWATDRSGGVGQGDIWIARRSFRSDGFSGVAPLNGVNSTSDETRAVLGNDGLTIYFSSNRPGGVGNRDIWVATRNDRSGTFSQVANLAGVNSSSDDVDPALSADGRELLFASGRNGSIRLWRSVRGCE